MDDSVSVLYTNLACRLQPSSSRLSLSRGAESNHTLSLSKLSVNSVHTIARTANNIAERYGRPIPVLVQELYTHSFERQQTLSARVSECGYAWVVCSRQLLIWQYHNIQNPLLSITEIPTCHTLRLPQSDLAHRAELVTVFVTENSQLPSCVAVSPEGMVRYWRDITHGQSFVDKRVNLNGEECDSLLYVGTYGCIFVTTTCTIVLIQWKDYKYGHKLLCRPLRAPGSWLGGLTKRVSSIFFGPISADQGSDTRIIRLLSKPGHQQIQHIFLLAGLNFQKWELVPNDLEQLCWSVDISRAVKDGFRGCITHWESLEPDEIDTWIIDLQPDRDGLLMLCAAANLQTSPQIYYGLASFEVKSDVEPTETRDFLLLRLMGLCGENSNPAEALAYRFILCGNNAYIYNSKTITVIKPQQDPEPIEFLHPNDHIYSGTSFSNIPIFFSRQHGLLAVKPAEADYTATSLNAINIDGSLPTSTESVHSNLSVYNLNPEEICEAQQDIDAQLKAAFIYHVKQQLSECYAIVNQLFPPSMPYTQSVDDTLDLAVERLATSIIDDVPTGDPRWSHKTGSQLGGSQSILILHQLTDKQKAFSLYLRFLKESGLWNRLAAITVHNVQVATIKHLCDLSEKITASIALKSTESSYVLDEAIRIASENCSTQSSGELSTHDVFYREVTKFHEFFPALAEITQKIVQSNANNKITLNHIRKGNEIMINILMEVFQYRDTNLETFSLNDVARSMNLECLPWTATDGPHGILDALRIQSSLIIKSGLHMTEEPLTKQQLIDQYTKLTDIILDGKRMHLESVSDGRSRSLVKMYTVERNELIKPLVQLNDVKSALTLAEKYMDFDVLLTVCEDDHQDTRLNEYMRRYRDTSFPEFAYNWYLKNGRISKILKRCQTLDGNLPEGNSKLKTYLSAYQMISWIQALMTGNYSSAADILRSQAYNEVDSLGRKKTMLSLAKLALSTGPQPNAEERISEINKSLKFLLFEESIPDYVLQSHGYDTGHLKVLTVEALVALFVSEEYVDATEVDFQKALEVAAYEEDEVKKIDLVLQIWRAVLLRDTWEFPNFEDLLHCFQQTLFYRLMDLTITLNSDPNHLPPIDMLLEDVSLDELKRKPAFHAVLKAGYEMFQRTQMI